MTDYLWEPIGLLVDQMEDVRKLRNHPLGDGSLDALELELMERTKVFWTPHMICANPLYCSFEKLGSLPSSLSPQDVNMVMNIN